MREEELRAHHQSTLLQLREKALKERAQAELEWLTLKKQQLRSKGDDDLMPPLVSREKGLLKKLHHEQVGGSTVCVLAGAYECREVCVQGIGVGISLQTPISPPKTFSSMHVHRLRESSPKLRTFSPSLAVTNV